MKNYEYKKLDNEEIVGLLEWLAVEEDEEKRDSIQMMILSSVKGIVKKIANKYNQVNGAELEDLVVEGEIAVLKNMGKFDSERGVKFSTYITNWIASAMSKYIETKSEKIYVPVMKKRVILHMNKIMSEGMSVEEAFEIFKKENVNQDYVGITLEKVKEILKFKIDFTGNVVKSEDAEHSIFDVIESNEDVAKDSMNNIAISQIMNILDEKEKGIWMMMGEGYDLGEIGEEFGVSNEAIRKIMLKIKEKVTKMYVVDYDKELEDMMSELTETEKDIIKFRGRGLSEKKVALKYNVSTDFIKNLYEGEWKQKIAEFKEEKNNEAREIAVA